MSSFSYGQRKKNQWRPKAKEQQQQQQQGREGRTQLSVYPPIFLFAWKERDRYSGRTERDPLISREVQMSMREREKIPPRKWFPSLIHLSVTNSRSCVCSVQREKKGTNWRLDIKVVALFSLVPLLLCGRTQKYIFSSSEQMTGLMSVTNGCCSCYIWEEIQLLFQHKENILANCRKKNFKLTHSCNPLRFSGLLCHFSWGLRIPLVIADFDYSRDSRV